MELVLTVLLVLLVVGLLVGGPRLPPGPYRAGIGGAGWIVVVAIIAFLLVGLD